MNPASLFLLPITSYIEQQILDLLKDKIIMVWGVDKELKRLDLKIRGMKALLESIEGTQIQSEDIQLLLKRLSEAKSKAEDIVDDCWREVRQSHDGRPEQEKKMKLGWCSLCPFSCTILERCRIGERIKKSVDEIGVIMANISEHNAIKQATGRPQQQERPVETNGRETHSFLGSTRVVGLDENTKNIVESILSTGKSNTEIGNSVYAITGMPGIGKTMLAKSVYNDEEVARRFDKRIWLCVSRNYNGNGLLKELICCISGQEKTEIGTMQRLMEEIAKLTEDMRLLLVLDDVWDTNSSSFGTFWNRNLKVALEKTMRGSVVLVTTRVEGIAQAMNAIGDRRYGVDPLSEEDSWSLLSKEVFGESPDQSMNLAMQELKKTGMEIVNNCRGVPLSILAIAGVLKDRAPNEAEWVRVSSSRTWDTNWLPSEDIQPALWLSFEDLDTHLRRCFTSCALYPEDYKFYQQNLVHLWIAEGFFNHVAREDDMEDEAERCYKTLISKNLLQELPDYYDGKGCTMHDLMHELALFVMSNSLVSRDTEHRHLYCIQKEVAVPEIGKEHKSLWTLLLSSNPDMVAIPEGLFMKVRHLRVLDLSYTGITTLPGSLKNLIHMRLLNLSFSKLKRLPESIRHLSDLQALQLHGCPLLKSLPEGIINLSHLRNLTMGADKIQMDHVPNGFNQLKRLRTLQGFVASMYGHGSNLSELKDLSRLRELTMYKLERVASSGLAEKANLRKKSLRYLKLSCTPAGDIDVPAAPITDDGITKVEDVFEALHPAGPLQTIHIEGYFGRAFPSWLTSTSGHPLSCTRILKLLDCKLCQRLPALGDMRKLEFLVICRLPEVGTMGPEFFGSAGFPALKELRIDGLKKLRQWDVPEGAFPFLKKLQILDCPKLVALPAGLRHVTCLGKLSVEGVKKIASIEGLRMVTELRLRRNRLLEAISDLPSLKLLKVRTCPAVKQVWGVDSLRYLVLSDPEMDALPEWLTGMPVLTKLGVECSHSLVAQCFMDRDRWRAIEHIPHVEMKSNKSSAVDQSRNEQGDGVVNRPPQRKLYISYTKDPYSFRSNCTDTASASSSSATSNAMPNTNSTS